MTDGHPIFVGFKSLSQAQKGWDCARGHACLYVFVSKADIRVITMSVEVTEIALSR